MATLTPLTADDFPEFFELAVAAYTSQNVAAGRWLPQNAEATGRRETEQLLAQGVETPNHSLFAITTEEQAEPVGYLWYAVMERGGAKIAYVVQISSGLNFGAEATPASHFARPTNWRSLAVTHRSI
jgi:hypothetical protein